MDKLSKLMVALIIMTTVVLLIDLFDVFAREGIRFFCYAILLVAGITFFFVDRNSVDSEE